ncbi:hypothetical protein ISN44_As13g005140 [Arabidopsis suecica]|uniref:Uncharacterized protein n=1 Tax=Arabidopsis suecica TaxID=45249 RepID=A0A8T1XZP3_ARASU|nr:hypothetical protein ISN44_As13g005140 [Arabidopsis suecica]
MVFSDNFTIVLFHYVGITSEWNDKFECSKNRGRNFPFNLLLAVQFDLATHESNSFPYRGLASGISGSFSGVGWLSSGNGGLLSVVLVGTSPAAVAYIVPFWPAFGFVSVVV